MILLNYKYVSSFKRPFILLFIYRDGQIAHLIPTIISPFSLVSTSSRTNSIIYKGLIQQVFFILVEFAVVKPYVLRLALSIIYLLNYDFFIISYEILWTIRRFIIFNIIICVTIITILQIDWLFSQKTFI